MCSTQKRSNVVRIIPVLKIHYTTEIRPINLMQKGLPSERFLPPHSSYPDEINDNLLTYCTRVG